MGNKLPLRIHIFAIITLSLFSCLLADLTWTNGLRETENRAKSLAQAVAAGLSSDHIGALSADSTDIEKPEYQEIKHALVQFAGMNTSARFASILMEKDGGIYIAVDSEPPSSKDYSPPGQKYEEATEVDFLSFKSPETIVTPVYTDRWGTWISVMVPIVADTSGIIGVLSVDYPVNGWYDQANYALIQSGIFSLCLFIIYFFMRHILLQNGILRLEKQKLLDKEKQLRESETLFRAIFDQATVGIRLGHTEEFIGSASTAWPMVNHMFERITGRCANELLSLRWNDILHPDDVDGAEALYQRFQAGDIVGYETEQRFVRPDGSIVWVRSLESSLHLENTPSINRLCMVEDISKRKNMEHVLFDSERSKSVILDNLPGMAYRCRYDPCWTMEFVSGGCLELTGYKPESLINNRDISFNALIAPAYRDIIWKKWTQALHKREKVTAEYELVTACGEWKWVWEQGQGIFDESGGVVALEGLVIDVTYRKEQELRLRYINEHEPLTGLYNRRYFEEMLKSSFLEGGDGKKALLLINIHKFSLINTAYGYEFGDALIQEVAACLADFMDENCLLFHLHIDRFALYRTRYTNADELTELCDTVLERLKTVLEPKSVGANIGVVEINEAYCDTGDIVKSASIAAEGVGATRRYGYSLYCTDMAQKITRVNDIKNELAEAVLTQNSRKLYLHYQPILDLKTGEICAFEALARFQSDRLGLLSPYEFVPIAEDTHLIVPMGKLVMRMACQTQKKFIDQSARPIMIHFNVSSIQLLRDDFISDLEEALNTTGSDPHYIGIELTESVFSNNYREINTKLDKIKQYGIKICIDDFGTGYSSLARERELNVDCLKIDKYFIDKLLDCAPETALTGDIISMGHKLGHDVIAEGVEHEAQKRYLIAHKCDKMQGYLFSKPVSEEKALALLLSQRFA